mmetsp:Transcript_71886/g.233642  ORF Transcript_71886/g.233642 Transcript_71886/m.233642 type:complete len:389 (-) Transcript_71886:201-1367(-)
MLGSEDNGATSVGGMLESSMNLVSSSRVCATTGNLMCFAQSSGALNTDLNFFEVTPSETWERRYGYPCRSKVKGFTTFADFGFTPNWFVASKPPLKPDSVAAGMGNQRIFEVLSYDLGAVSELLFVSREKGGPEIRVPIDGLVFKEFANAYEPEAGRVVLDVVAADRWDLGGRPSGAAAPWETEDPSTRPRTKLVRYEVDLNAKTWTRRDLCGEHLEFASVNASVAGKPHRYVFAALAHGASGDEAGPAAGVAKIDVVSGAVDKWVPGPTEFGGQPVFVPRPGSSDEDDGYLINVIFDGATSRSDVVILDARSVSSGPVCRFALKDPMPHGTRAVWAPDFIPTEKEMKRKTTLLKMFRKKSGAWNAWSSGASILAQDVFFAKQGTKMR